MNVANKNEPDVDASYDKMIFAFYITIGNASGVDQMFVTHCNILFTNRQCRLLRFLWRHVLAAWRQPPAA